MKFTLALLLILSAFKVNACALSTYYWPIPMGYVEGAIDFAGIINKQVSWDAKSAINFNIKPALDNVAGNIDKIIDHQKFVKLFPDLVKGLDLNGFELVSFRVEPLNGNSFINTEGRLEGVLLYLLPGLSYEQMQGKWLIILEYKLTYSFPSGELNLYHNLEIPTLPDGTILYEYPGLGGCG